MNLSEVGKEVGLTRERVRQIVAGAVGETFTRERWRQQREEAAKQLEDDRAARRAYRGSLDWIRDRSMVDENGCWIWKFATYPTGYGHCARDSGYAHRVSWEIANGPIPAGLTIDHLCRVRACVNPDHLDAVTIRENILRSPFAVAAINARKTHCVRGHPFDEENTRLDSHGRRICRTCHRVQQARRRRKVDRPPREACDHGHRYEGDSFYVDGNGWRVCRICVRARVAKHYKKKRGALKWLP